MNTTHKTQTRSAVRTQNSLVLTASALLVLSGGGAWAQSSSGAAILHTQQISAGTEVKLTLQQGVNSGNAQIGDRVRAVTATDDRSGLPVGTAFYGRVTEVKPATAKYPGALTVSFGIPREHASNAPSNYDNGNGTYATPNSTLNGDTQPYRDNNDGGPTMAFTNAASAHLTGQAARADRSNYASIGAGAGALLGFVRKRKLGDAIGGAVLGGAGGAAANAVQKRAGGDVDLPKGAEMTVHLNSPLVLRTEIVAPY